jgi:hypothetical protein
MDSKVDIALLVQALEAHERWFEAENKYLGTFHDRMNLCSYAEHLMHKALAHVRGEQFTDEWKGVPQLVLTTGGTNG